MAKVALVYFGVTSELVVIDTATSVANRVDGMRGRVSPKTLIAHPDGTLYFGTANSGDFCSYKDGTLRIIGACGDRDYYSGFLAADGKVYLGTFWRGQLEIYDPVADTLSQVGEFDAAMTAPQYVYSIVSDGTYAYAGMGQTPWYLAVINVATGDAVQYFKADGDVLGGAHAAVEGPTLYYARKLANNAVVYYQLVGGEPVQIETALVPPLRPSYRLNGVTTDKAQFTAAGIEVDLDDAGAVTGVTPEIRWRATGEEDWSSAAVTGLTLKPVVIKRLVDVGAARLLGLPYGYNPPFWYDPATKTAEVAGWQQSSLYDALAIGTDVYLSGYTAMTLRWDTTQPWTVTLGTTDLTATNPRQVGNWHKYHYFQCVGSDGLLYVGVNHERDSVGGTLGWYNPATDAVDDLRDPFLRFAPRGVVAVGDNIVYSGSSLDAEPGELFVVPTATHTLTRSFAPAAAHTSAGAIVAVSDTDVVGIVKTTAYRVNVETEQVVWTVTLPGAAFGNMNWYDRRIATAADGWLWFAIGMNIYKLNPADGAVTLVASPGATHNVVFFGGVPFLYGTMSIKRIIL